MPVCTISRKSNTLIILDRCSGTNNYAMQLTRSGMAADGLAILAHYQTAGKGQHQRTWYSNPGESILLSVMVYTREMPADKIFLLSMAVAISVAQFFNDYVPDTVHIKWPNDIYWNDKKAGGILIEPILRGNTCQFAIVGIGLNINQEIFPGHLDKAISMFMAGSNKQQIVPITMKLRQAVLESISFCLAYPDKIISLYNQLLYRNGEDVLFEINHQISKHRIRGVNSTGQIMLDATATCYYHGEAKWIVD